MTEPSWIVGSDVGVINDGNRTIFNTGSGDDDIRVEIDPKTGDFEWHSVLMDIKRRNPGMSNVYPEVGSFFNALVVADPVLCMHGMGKNIKHYGADHVVWGTDCLWWGSPQWAIEAFKRFDISDEFVEKFGYAKISKADKAKILGLNAAKLYDIEVPSEFAVSTTADETGAPGHELVDDTAGAGSQA